MASGDILRLGGFDRSLYKPFRNFNLQSMNTDGGVYNAPNWETVLNITGKGYVDYVMAQGSSKMTSYMRVTVDGVAVFDSPVYSLSGISVIDYLWNTGSMYGFMCPGSNTYYDTTMGSWQTQTVLSSNTTLDVYIPGTVANNSGFGNCIYLLRDKPLIFNSSFKVEIYNMCDGISGARHTFGSANVIGGIRI
jgi:hypothetical protein